jgi:hypothetical protein
MCILLAHTALSDVIAACAHLNKKASHVPVELPVFADACAISDHVQEYLRTCLHAVNLLLLTGKHSNTVAHVASYRHAYHVVPV